MAQATTSDLATIWNQISTDTKLACGARMPAADGSTYLHFQVGSGAFRKITIRLNGLDLYDVKLVRINRRTFETVVEAESENVYAEDLSNVIYGLCNR